MAFSFFMDIADCLPLGMSLENFFTIDSEVIVNDLQNASVVATL
jgi:hypothetical protein